MPKEDDKRNIIKRIPSGIPGLDELIQGGFPENTLNLLTGVYGTGRTIFALQFLYNGAKKGEPGVYISLEKQPEEIKEIMRSFGWEVDELIKNKMFSILKPDLHKFDTFKQTLEDEVDRLEAKRIVINPFSLISAYFNNIYDTRRALFEFRRQMEKLGCTGLMITDAIEGNNEVSFGRIAEFVTNGVILLDLLLKKESNTFVRTINIRKMERTNHSLKLIPIEISKNGIEVYYDAEVF